MFGHPNHQILFDWHQNTFSATQWKKLLWVTEHPPCNAEHLYKYKLHEFAKHHYPDLKVMLLGQGSDEFNGGYATTLLQAKQNVAGWEAFMRLLSLQKRAELYLYPSMASVDRFSPVFPLLNFSYLLQRNDEPMQVEDPWYFNTMMSRKKLQMHNLWHEDRTAAGNSIENRVPFLDHRLVEFCIKVPPEKRAALFWDKAILRKAMTPYLPETITSREKVPLFHGIDTRYTNRLLYNILMSENQALLEEAFGADCHANPVISHESIRNILSSMARDPEYAGIETIFLLTNAVLLEKMAKDIGPQAAIDSTFKLMPEVIIKDWKEEYDQLQLTLGTRREELSIDSIVQFTPGTFLAKDDSCQNKTVKNYIIVNRQVVYYFDQDDSPDWLEFLRRIDGKIPIKTILQDLNISEAAIRKYLEEAIDYNILSIVVNEQ